MKKTILFGLLLAASCGIEGPTSTISLYPPGALNVYYNSGTQEYTVMFQGLNPETGFSGYNLYYTTNLGTANLGQGQKVSLKTNLNTNLDPTFAVNPPFATVSNFRYTLNRDQLPATFFDPTVSAYSFYFILRAYDRSAARESVSSLYSETRPLP